MQPLWLIPTTQTQSKEKLFTYILNPHYFKGLEIQNKTKTFFKNVVFKTCIWTAIFKNSSVVKEIRSAISETDVIIHVNIKLCSRKRCCCCWIIYGEFSLVWIKFNTWIKYFRLSNIIISIFCFKSGIYIFLICLICSQYWKQIFQDKGYFYHLKTWKRMNVSADMWHKIQIF